MESNTDFECRDYLHETCLEKQAEEQVMTTVLVVDDLASQRQLVAGLLCRQRRYELAFAGNGKEALQRLGAQPVDLVVTDLMMPEMDGLELLRAVRRDYPQLPVILMTASGSEHLAVQALQEGAASYVPKSVLARRLAETVASVLSASRKERTHVQLGRRLTSQEFKFVLENDADLILGLPFYLKTYLLAAGFTDHLTLVRMHMVLEEALVNALYHGNLEVGTQMREQNSDEFFLLASNRAKESPYQERRIRVGVKLLTGEEAEFTIRDEGPGFNPANLPHSDDVASLDQPHGRGVRLMRTFMDEVRYNETGNMVTMVKRLKPVVAREA
jgi:CheY-like chemotaxis protein/anti-sigma regulatory factor (Ser/Thr protein kinase)